MSVMVTNYKPDLSRRQPAFVRAMNRISKLVGTSLKGPLDEVRLTQKGVSPTVFESLKQLGFSATELQWVIKPRTLAHRKSKRESLTQEETGRWLRAIKIQALAVEVFGDDQKANAWLHKARKHFGGQSALEVMQSESGAQLVEASLSQIDAGYFA